jgi:hypothetical protein
VLGLIWASHHLPCHSVRRYLAFPPVLDGLNIEKRS